MKLYDRPFNFSRFRCDWLGQTKVGIEIETAGPNECSKNYRVSIWKVVKEASVRSWHLKWDLNDEEEAGTWTPKGRKSVLNWKNNKFKVLETENPLAWLNENMGQSDFELLNDAEHERVEVPETGWYPIRAWV